MALTRVGLFGLSAAVDTLALPAFNGDLDAAVAAVADYRPGEPVREKIKKGDKPLQVTLTPNPDILAEVAARPDAPFCVGFAAESHDLESYAEGKRQKKKLALVVGNLVQDGLGGDDNSVILFDERGRHPLGPASKMEIARGIVDHIAQMLAGGEEED